MTPELRAKLWAKRCKTKRAARHVGLTHLRRLTSGTYQRAQLLVTTAADGMSFFDTCVLCGCGDASLRTWLYRRSGATTWPPSAEQIAHLQALAEKVWVDCN